MSVLGGRIMICRKCGKEIENGAAVCTYCGETFKRKKPVYKKWWFWVLMGFATIISVGIISSSEDTSIDTSSTVSTSSAVSQTEITYEVVDLRKMIDDLDTNALKAEKTYQNKNIEVVGIITNFDSDGSYIGIEPVNADAWDFTSVTCRIKNDAQLNFLLEKEVGDEVTIKGKVYSVGEVLGYTIKIDEVF